MQIQWYPGHMTKARRMLEENLKIVDVIVTVLDARIPASSWNPDVARLTKGKEMIVLLNKADLANSEITIRWIEYFRTKGYAAIPVTCTNKGEKKKVLTAINSAAKRRVEALKKRGVNKVVRVMVLGVPNAGKSTLINMICGYNAAKTEDRPGVTRGRQWIRINQYLELMDTPGLLWPKFDDDSTGMHLAFCGSINEQIINTEELCLHLLAALRSIAPDGLMERYRLEELDGDDAVNLERICRARGFIRKGNVPDIERAVSVILNEFREGKIGRISLEQPEF
ncbi:MAG: ribosome biogenesis GTPase YlqF [Clostridia bacterium]|nr:ribosome biogenesis GTPase YlqF [Clostridia bacterium]